MNRTVTLSLLALLSLSACAPKEDNSLATQAAAAGTVTAAQAYARNCLTAVEIQKVERNAPDYSFVPAQATCADAFLGESTPAARPEVKASVINTTADRQNVTITVTLQNDTTYTYDGSNFVSN